MRRASASVAAVGLAITLVTLTGCPMPPSNAARMQQQASDFNTDIRFGRNELAIEKVGEKEREDFLRRHKAWGKTVTLADYELIGAKMVDDDHAEVSIKYDWYHSDENELHATTVRQKWQTYHGDWRLTGESCIDGDETLFAVGAPRARPESPQPIHSVQFPTVRLGD
jgi:hypothetical protein